MIAASVPTRPSGESSSSPPKSSENCMMFAIAAIAPATIAAIDEHEDVAVLDVRELVREHALDLIRRQVVQQPLA